MVTATCVALLSLISRGPDSTGCVAQGPTADASGRANAPLGPRTRIMLQVIPAFPMPDHLVAMIVTETAAIWAPYRVEVTATRELVRTSFWQGAWMTLVIRDSPGPPSRGCQGADGAGALACLAFENGAPAHQISASWEAARRLVVAANLDHLPPVGRDTFAARVLGRAIAHELGHYLLGTMSHTSHGLMRMAFDARDVWASDRRAFRLDPSQLTTLEARGR